MALRRWDIPAHRRPLLRSATRSSTHTWCLRRSKPKRDREGAVSARRTVLVRVAFDVGDVCAHSSPLASKSWHLQSAPSALLLIELFDNSRKTEDRPKGTGKKPSSAKHMGHRMKGLSSIWSVAHHIYMRCPTFSKSLQGTRAHTTPIPKQRPTPWGKLN
jgi:hypothetical protein